MYGCLVFVFNNVLCSFCGDTGIDTELVIETDNHVQSMSGQKKPLAGDSKRPAVH